MARPYLVFGLGRFGSYLAESLSEFGVDVIALDHSTKRVDEIKAKVQVAAVCKADDRDSIHRLVEDGVGMAIVAIIDYLESSVMATLLLKDLGVETIIATARTADHARLLKMIGATLVVNPEIEFSRRFARSIMSNALMDFQSIGRKHGIAEVKPLEPWVGKSLSQLELRREHKINVIAIQRGVEGSMIYQLMEEREFEGEMVIPEPDTVVEAGDLILLFGPVKELRSLGLMK